MKVGSMSQQNYDTKHCVPTQGEGNMRRCRKQKNVPLNGCYIRKIFKFVKCTQYVANRGVC
jgi:hypothetical protein